MPFTINTNVAALLDQYYLNGTQASQQKAITRLSSGLRINTSGDDAAGLAIANGYRSDEAVLTQGIRNANDGLSALQVADGGLNNISQLLDRARTLATQSASGTFTGDRDVLNSEFQSVLQELDRQAQVIGLNTGGTFAAPLSVFIGGGAASNGVSATANGAVSFDLSKSTVDARSLGLKNSQAIGGTVLTQDLGNSSATSVSTILANATNTGSEAVGGYTQFFLTGPGFSGANRVALNVNLTGVVDTATLATAVNAAISGAANGGTQYATAFKNANVTASINTDTSGKQQLTFNSSVAAFQVQAGDRVANALLGNYSAGSTGKDLANTVTSGVVTTAGSGFTQNAVIRIQGSGLAAPVDINIASGQTTAQAIATISSTVASNTALQAAGITVSGVTAVGTAITFTSKRGEQFSVAVTGDNANLLGLGSYSNYSGGTAFDYTSVTGTGAAFTASAAQTFDISVNGGAVQSITATLGGTTGIADAVNQLNTAFAQNATLTAAGIHATNAAGQVQISSNNGTAFRINANNAATNVFGFGNTGAVAGGGAATLTQADNTDNVHYNAIGEYATSAFRFAAPLNGQDDQTVTFSANDAAGTAHTAEVVLQNNGTARNARSLDEAIATINTALQATNDSVLTKIVAVKDFVSAGVEGIRFIKADAAFNVTLGAAGTGTTVGIGQAADQGQVQAATQLTATDANGDTISGGSADISNISTASAAVEALADSVALLGKAQGVVGRSQNQLNFAITLAQSQLTNKSAAESRIRDADLAAESANLTKANILLQAGVAALAQANSAPQQVLQLLRF